MLFVPTLLDAQQAPIARHKYVRTQRSERISAHDLLDFSTLPSRYSPSLEDSQSRWLWHPTIRHAGRTTASLNWRMPSVRFGPSGRHAMPDPFDRALKQLRI